MPCFKPLDCWQACEPSPTGKKQIYFSVRRRRPADTRSRVACGRCIGCRLDRSREWAIRCAHESQFHDSNSFITLTFAKDPVTLEHKYFQDFMKRLRDRTKTKLLYYMCGEYGSVYDERGQKRDGLLGRPHFHALLFGIDFPDRTFFKKSGSGFPIYNSELLSDTWKHGHACVQDFSIEAAAYVARYVTKKITGPQAPEHYQKEAIDIETGECLKVAVKPEYTRMSLRPAIGKKWVERYYRDCYPSDFITHDGIKFKPPKYYDKFAEGIIPDEYEAVKASREAYARRNQDTADRLLTREKCAQKRAQKLLRPL